MSKPRWHAFPHPDASFDYAGAKLKKAWPRLHRGDAEPFPDAAWVTQILDEAPTAGKSIKGKAEPKAIAEALGDAWRAYHRGDFEQACTQGEALGVLGATVANKAEGIHATHLETDTARQLASFERCAERAERQQEALPGHANAWYFHAFSLGRYSQGISIAKALAQGLGGKIKTSLSQALELEPRHADAHLALALWHAEVINKVGAMIGGLTYGAKAALADKHFAEALKLFPESPVAHMESGNGLLLLHGDRKQDQAVRAYEKAVSLAPADAMERLDIELARSELEDE